MVRAGEIERKRVSGLLSILQCRTSILWCCGLAGSDDSSHHREGEHYGQGNKNHGVGVARTAVWKLRSSGSHRPSQRDPARDERHRETAERPSQPSGCAAAYPCPFCHNTTLQDYDLPRVTARVSYQGERTSENSVKKLSEKGCE